MMPLRLRWRLRLTTPLLSRIRLRSRPRLSHRRIMNNGVHCFSIEQTLRKHILQLKPYSPIEPFHIVAEKTGKSIEEVVKLDANENLYGPPSEVFTALATLEGGNIYPDPEVRRLRKKLSEWLGMPMENLLVGCGADELIDLILRCLLEDGDYVVDCPPTFTMYAFDVRLNNGNIIEIPRNANFGIDVAGIRKAVLEYHPKALFLTSPNNPDGSLISDEDLLTVLDLPVMVIMDEAYQDFTDVPSRMDWVLKYPNLVVLRTFSKCAALAGLRVGYGAFPLEFASYLWRARQPYNVSVAAEVAACTALEHPTYMKETRDLIVKERQRLFQLLQDIPFLEPYPSESNFILCKVVGAEAFMVKETLYNKGILIRHFGTELLKNCVRISVGRSQDTDAVITALKQLQV